MNFLWKSHTTNVSLIECHSMYEILSFKWGGWLLILPLHILRHYNRTLESNY